jgi:prepilin-type N-terminal cleavage/methylation domain-containing protein
MPAKIICRRHYLTGFTIIEMMVTILVLAIIVIGTAGYRYYSALDARKAVKESDAARVALMLLESWRAHQGDPLFDPTTNPPLFNPSGFITKSSGSFPPGPEDAGITWTSLGSYTITMQSVNPSESALTYYVTLSYNNNDYKPGLRILNATAAWPISINEQNYTTSGNYWTISLTTYAEILF